MLAPVWIAGAEGDLALTDTAWPLPLDELVAGSGPWEVELGFGKGRYLLDRALAEPEGRFLGIEMVSHYYRLLRDRARRRGARNLLLFRGEALYLMAAVLPPAFAAAVHVYFPDPWPKARQHKRRLFDAETVDLVTGLLAPGGRLCFATDHLAYGELVHELLLSHGGLEVRELDGGWPTGPRTNYEIKYVAEGRPILRLEALALAGAGAFHPRGERSVLAASGPREES